MQAIILAAGRGSRLRPLTDEVPKSLVEINGESFLTNDLDALAKHDEVKEVIIVLGYKKDMIKNKIGEEYKGLKITYVENDDWNTTNNIYSLWMAMDKVQDDFILMEGDIFFDHSILDCIFENRDRNIAFLSPYDPDTPGTVVKLDEKGSKMASKTLVEMNEPEHRVKRMIPSSEQDMSFDYSDKFKTVNIYYFTYEFFKDYFEPRLDLYIKTHDVDSYYELILGILIYLNTPNIYGHIVDREKWYEVDTESDLEMAKYIFSEKEERIDQLENLFGGYWRYDFLDFNFLYNLYFPPQQFYSKLGHELSHLVSNYSSAQHKIASLLSQWYNEEGFCQENILVGNGASEFIRIINRHLIEKITIPVPSFNEYEDLEPSQINYFQLLEKDDFEIDEDAFIESVKSSGSNFAVIINPNNPTSTITEKDKIINILDNLQDLDGIIVDESFIDFAGDREKHSVQTLVDKYPNLILLRSLSKEFGVPGLRLGYIVTSNQELKEKINHYLPIWNINSIAEKFIESFPRYQNEYDDSIEQILLDRKEFIEKLENIDMLDVIEGKANFVFCRIDNENISSTRLRNKLFSEHDMLIKDCLNKTSLDDRFVRISVRKPEQNEKLVKAIKEIEKAL